MNTIFEKLGIFYLGKDLADETLEPTDTPTLVKSKHFTTHAAVIGMTGSGKTGLGVGILEEAAIDNIPVIAIDPKGDIGNLALAFERLDAEEFLPWVEEEARQKGVEPGEYARKIARMWREGIESFGQDRERIARFKEHDVTIYTPGSSAGVPVNILSSLEVPDKTLLEDADALASTINSTVASLLSLVSIEADPLESREFILLAQIIKRAWIAGESLDMGTLIARMITPPFSKIGVLPLESFYPPSERFKLASKFNNVLASPTFENWLKGDPLDIDDLLYDANRTSKISIFSIAHLSDQERMFFVTLLLNRIVGWMRRQSGTGRLRALVYMDEIYGYFPPSKNPPSKEPMMLMLKQARAFGVGMVLSTQNPVDLDYKGLSNIGTWLIGRLQTKQDISKVIEGLSGKLGGSLSRERVAQILSSLPKRVFFLKSAHEERVRLFGTRWVLSYLKGPLQKREIARLMERKRDRGTKEEKPLPTGPSAPASAAVSPPVLASSIPCRYDTPRERGGTYLPALAARATVRFFNASRGIDLVEEHCTLLELEEGMERLDWEEAQPCDESFEEAPKTPASEVSFAPLPPFVASARGIKPFKKGLADHLYAHRRLELFRCRPLKMESSPGETRERFAQRVAEALEERREAEAQKLEARYEKRLETLRKRYERALQKLEKEEEDVQQKTADSLIDTGLALFGAFFGGRRGAVGKAGRALRSGKRILKERSDVQRAKEQVESVEASIESLRDELQERLDDLDTRYDTERFPIESFFIKPRRSDIRIETMLLYWNWRG